MKWKNILQPLFEVAAPQLSVHLCRSFASTEYNSTFSKPQMLARKDALHLVRANETCSMDQKCVVDFLSSTKPAGRLGIAATGDFTGDLAATGYDGGKWKAVEMASNAAAAVVESYQSVVPGVHEAASGVL